MSYFIGIAHNPDVFSSSLKNYLTSWDQFLVISLKLAASATVLKLRLNYNDELANDDSVSISARRWMGPEWKKYRWEMTSDSSGSVASRCTTRGSFGRAARSSNPIAR